MALETRWFVISIGQLSQAPQWRQGNARGFLPAFLEFLDPADGLGKAGSWYAHAPAMAAGVSLAAITFDTEAHPSAKRGTVWAKLAAAPGARVLSLPADLGSSEQGFAKRDALATRLQAGLVDVGRFRNPARDIRYHAREIARTLMLYGALGRHFHPVPLSAPLSTITAAGRQAMSEWLEEGGFPTAKLPSPSETFQDFYRRALADPWADFGIDSGAWHLGHPDANLASP